MFLRWDFRQFVQETAFIAKELQQMLQQLGTKPSNLTRIFPIDPTGADPSPRLMRGDSTHKRRNSVNLGGGRHFCPKIYA